jgi:single-strand DNA-binding protein
MSDTYVTLHGWVGSDVTYRNPNDVSVVNFRVASTPRLKKGGEWMDGDTTWYSVTAWRHLAENIRDSVRKGDAVVVHGKLRTDLWEREDGQTTSSLRIEASLVGHDLTRGSSTFLRSQRPARPDTSEVEQDVEATIRQQEMEGSPSVDSWGNQVDPPPEGPEDAGDPDDLGDLVDRSGLGGLGAA